MLRKISLFQFRNYGQAAFSLEFPVTCITGRNGSGKTNLLDAVYTLCYTKSYFASGVQATVMQGTEGYRVEGDFEQNGRQETVICKYKNARKEISCAGVTYEKQTDHIGKYAAVIIAPDDIELINDGSELRRKFIDSILGQCDKQYLEALLQYNKVLAQRNAWLKLYSNSGNGDQASLEYYDRLLAESGTYLFDRRRLFLEEFVPLLQKYYHVLSEGREQAGIHYQSDLFTQRLGITLEQHLQQDIRYQRTLRGTHKDELLFLLNDNSVKSYASQGQKKSFLFSLKLAQFEYLKTKMGHSPILLLDDVFEKLDQQRMEALLSIIRSPIFHQVILTDTHEQRIKDAFGEESAIGFVRLP